eukprot:7093827-Prymnesium_polylepis.1
MDVHSVSVLCESDISKESEAENVDAQTSGVTAAARAESAPLLRRGCSARESGAPDVMLEECQGVTVERAS